MSMVAEFWNEIAGPKWVEQQVQLDAVMAAHLELLVGAAELAAGQRVVDVGCGCGALSLAAARLGCSVRGVDISRPMLAHARGRASTESLDIDFAEADAQTHALPPGTADRLLSRFGVMFFPDAPAAFANLRGWLAPGGELHFLCWQPLEENPWMSKVLDIAEPWLEPQPSAPHAPGPFSLGDPERLRAVLGAAGFEDTLVTDVRLPMSVEGSPEEALRFYLERGPIKSAMSQSDEARAAVREALMALMVAEHDGEAVSMDGACWLVRAR